MPSFDPCAIERLRDKIGKLKLLVCDFDGVFTNGRIIIDETGRESSICSRKDTLRLAEIQAKGIEVVVVSQERNPLVSKRCQKMQVECSQGVMRKIEALHRLSEEKKTPFEKMAFVGDDINDLECMRAVPLVFTVADAVDECKELADYVTRRNGGDHAFREICDLILSVR